MRMLESIPDKSTCPNWNYQQIFIFVATGSKDHVLGTGILMQMLESIPDKSTCPNQNYQQIFNFVVKESKQRVLGTGILNVKARINS